MRKVKSVRELDVYKKAFAVAMKIFDITKEFPIEEKYSLIDQIRRSSRSVCANLSESWRKRRYEKVFINKLSDAACEAAETQTWLEFSYACKYITEDIFNELDSEYEHVFAMIYTMEKKSNIFCKHTS